MKTRTRLCVFLSLVFLTGTPLYAPASDVDNVKEFRARVEEYAMLHRSVEGKLPALPQKATSDQIAAHQQGLAEAIRTARSKAKRGDVFSKAKDYFRRAIAAELKGKAGLTARQTIKEGNPTNEASGGPIILSVNAGYPPEASLSAMPPTMLLRLPPLPEELNYRFVGRHLILHDTDADIIVDFILNVAP